MQHCFNRLLSPARGALPAAASAIAMAILLAAAPAGAAELGDIAVRTYLNQPLTADIELVMLTPEEAAEGVPVRMAGANIYQGANVRMHPALAGARLSVQRKDQRLVVHIATLQPVDTEVVHLFLELGSGSRAVVRSVTLWLTPEPPGAPRPPVVRPLPGQVIAQEPAARPPAAAPLRPAPLPPPVDIVRPAPVRPAPLPAPAESAPPAAAASAPAAVTSEPALPGFAPSEAALIAARARASAEREAQARRAAQAGHGAPGILGAMPPRTAPARAACTPGRRDGEAKQCVALDQKNVELNAKIRDLEGKVQALQSALGAPAAGPAVPRTAGAASAAGSVAPAEANASAAPVAASAAPAAPSPAASVPMNPAGAVIPPSNGANGKKERRSGLNSTTQILLGVVAALAVLGGLAYLIRKNMLKLPAKEKLMFWKRWKRNKQEAEEVQPAAPQEPVLDKDSEQI